MMITNYTKLPALLLIALSLFIFAGCGGGDGSSSGQKEVIVTFSLNGDAATTVGSVDFDVTLPDSFTLENDTNDQPTVAALSFLVGDATSDANYTPKTNAANGLIAAAMIKADGFCKIRSTLDTQSDLNWTPNPERTGHSIRFRLDSESDLNWTLFSDFRI